VKKKTGISKGEEAMAEPSKGERSEEPPRRALRHPIRVRIVAACSQREMTPKEFAIREKRRVRTVNNHFRALEKAGYLQRVPWGMDSGFQRFFYKAIRQAVITDDEFAQMPAAAQHQTSEAVLRDLVKHCWRALRLGTLDARPDSHLTWIPLKLDELGWKELMSELARTFERALEIQAGARVRLRKSGESPVPTTIALAGFERPVEEPPETP
jgi:DNA-binding transcriptional ArsR family regulator